MTHRLPVLAALVTAGLAAAPSAASADIRIRVGGRAHVHARTGVHIRTPRVHWRPRWHYSRPARVRVGGSIWVGGGYYYNRTYAAPPPAYCECGPSTVPSYYPVAPQPTTDAAAVAVRPELPRFGLGVFAGGVDVEGDHEGSDYGLFARLRLTPGLSVIGEIGKSEIEDGDRVDRRIGGGLIWELGAYNRWAPYLVGEVGVMQSEVGDDWETTQSFGELGVGLRFNLTNNLSLSFDIRGGSRHRIDDEDDRGFDAAARELLPGDDEGEEIVRGQGALTLWF